MLSSFIPMAYPWYNIFIQLIQYLSLFCYKELNKLNHYIYNIISEISNIKKYKNKLYWKVIKKFGKMSLKNKLNW